MVFTKRVPAWVVLRLCPVLGFGLRRHSQGNLHVYPWRQLCGNDGRRVCSIFCYSFPSIVVVVSVLLTNFIFFLHIHNRYISGIPVLLAHAVYFWVYAALYLLWTLVYWAAGGALIVCCVEQRFLFLSSLTTFFVSLFLCFFVSLFLCFPYWALQAPMRMATRIFTARSTGRTTRAVRSVWRLSCC